MLARCLKLAKLIQIEVILLLTVVSTATNAALVSRLNGAAFFDTDTGITWDANRSVGAWSHAVTRADQSILGGFSDWLLPTVDELGHLYYEHGITSYYSDPFTNFYDPNYGYYAYWSREYSALLADKRRAFNYLDGVDDTLRAQDDWWYRVKSIRLMRYGDVEASSSPVPLPGALWLFGGGVIALLGFAHKSR